jgi:hypothetical protein
MKELIREIENQKDFYTKPVLGTLNNNQNNSKLEHPQGNSNLHEIVNPQSINSNKTKKPRYYNNLSSKHNNSDLNNSKYNNHEDVIPNRKNTKRVRRNYIKKHCPNCNTIVEDDDVFCINCGYKLAKRFCPYCGTKINDDSSIFCFNCGKKL